MRISRNLLVKCGSVAWTDGQTLRVRHLTFSPDFDFGEYGVDEYASLLGQLHNEIINVSEHVMPAKHIKIYLPSIPDRMFFSVTEVLATTSTFATVVTKGSWFYVTKRQ